MNATTAHALNDFFIRYADFNNGINADAVGVKSFSLRNGTWETVKEEAVGTVSLGNAILNKTDDDVIRYELALIHNTALLEGLSDTRRAISAFSVCCLTASMMAWKLEPKPLANTAIFFILN